MKNYADSRARAKPHTFKIGDRVLVKRPKVNKFSTPFDPRPYTVVNIKGSMISARLHGNTITRNSSFFKLYRSLERSIIDDDDAYSVCSEQPMEQIPANEPEGHRKAYPRRNRQPPDRYRP